MRHVVEESQPLSEPVFLILTSLAEEPRHGYALLLDIEKITDGRVRLSTGTLYGALSRLLRARWIERFKSDDTSRDKQCYALTTVGVRHLSEDLDRLRSLSRVAATRLRIKEA
jgi:DNA-binding PadR family transcriptional regulator